MSENINKECASITKIIRTSANDSIPLSNTNRRSYKNVPWWSKLLTDLRDKKQAAWKNFRNNLSTINLIDYKKKNALFNKQKKLAKAKSLEQFTEKLNPSLDIGTIWKHIKTLTGNYTPFCINTITHNNIKITDPLAIPSSFVKHYSDQSNTNNFHSLFISHYNILYNLTPSSDSHPKAKFLELDINFNELSNCLSICSVGYNAWN